MKSRNLCYIAVCNYGHTKLGRIEDMFASLKHLLVIHVVISSVLWDYINNERGHVSFGYISKLVSLVKR